MIVSIGNENLMQRIMRIVESPSVKVAPVGELPVAERGIVRVARDGRFERLGEAVKLAFGATLVAAALVSAPKAHANGWDANIYGQQQGQVMSQGNATRMVVVDVRAAKIEVAPPANSGMSQVGNYAVTAAGTGVGAIAGSQMGKTPQARQIGAILGGLIGGVASNMATQAMNGPAGPRLVDAVQLTLENPITHQLATITQAGSSTFRPGDPVFVIQSGNSWRVVPDQTLERPQSRGGQQGFIERAPGDRGNGAPDAFAEQATQGVLKAGRMMGVQLDARQVSQMMETGMASRQGIFVGKVVGVDAEAGLVYQDVGRGQGVVYPANALSRLPAVGEMMTVRVKDGYGAVEAAKTQQIAGRGRH